MSHTKISYLIYKSSGVSLYYYMSMWRDALFCKALIKNFYMYKNMCIINGYVLCKCTFNWYERIFLNFNSFDLNLVFFKWYLLQAVALSKQEEAEEQNSILLSPAKQVAPPSTSNRIPRERPRTGTKVKHGLNKELLEKCKSLHMVSTYMYMYLSSFHSCDIYLISCIFIFILFGGI